MPSNIWIVQRFDAKSNQREKHEVFHRWDAHERKVLEQIVVLTLATVNLEAHCQVLREDSARVKLMFA